MGGKKEQNITFVESTFADFLKCFSQLLLKSLEGKENQIQIITNKLEVFKDLVSIAGESAIAFGSFNIHFLTYQHIL